MNTSPTPNPREIVAKIALVRGMIHTFRAQGGASRMPVQMVPDPESRGQGGEVVAWPARANDGRSAARSFALNSRRRKSPRSRDS
jgi:hypothetical protein